MLETEITIATRDNAFELGIMHLGELTPFTCPACHGALVRLKEGNLIRFRCHTGHAYSANSLLADLSTSVNELMVQAMRGAEEMNLLTSHLQKHLINDGHKSQAAIFKTKAEEARRLARQIYQLIQEQDVFSEDIKIDVDAV